VICLFDAHILSKVLYGGGRGGEEEGGAMHCMMPLPSPQAVPSFLCRSALLGITVQYHARTLKNTSTGHFKLYVLYRDNKSLWEI
jgi:hypothetical protein